MTVELLRDLTKRELVRAERLVRIRKKRLDFALDCHINSRGEKLNFKDYPHIRQLYESTAPNIVLQGAVQSFKSEWAIVDHFAAAFTGLSVFYIVPKYEIRTTYVQNRINKVVENVHEYKSIVGAGFFDSVALKSFGRGTIKYVAASVISDMKEFPADALYVDEVDQCNADNVHYAVDRLMASPYKFKRYLGNPTIKNRGINALFLDSNQQEWHFKCPWCGKPVEASWFDSVVQEVYDKSGNVSDYILRDTEWEPGCGRDIYLICIQCNGAVDRGDFRGEWISKGEGGLEGYHISMLCSSLNSIAGMWSRFKKALYTPLRLQQFYNSDLGLPYSAAGSKVTLDVLLNCVEPSYKVLIFDDYACIADDAHVGPCSMGVDVGANFDVRISYIEPRGQRRLVYVGKFPVKNPEIIQDLVERYNVVCCVMDAMPESALVQDLQEKLPCDTWLCTYRGAGRGTKRKYDNISKIIGIDRTEALDRSYADMVKRYNILPANFEAMLGGTYVNELCASVREVIEDSNGAFRYEWSKGVDHHFHADTYDRLAAEMLTDSVLSDVVVA